MSLQLQAIDRLFDRLAASYGSSWTRLWDGVEADAVKSMWAHELGSYSKNLGAIAWALENLPDRCPNLIEFRNLCRLSPAPVVPQLPEPKAYPQRVAAELAKLGSIRLNPSEISPHGMKQWAYTLKEREEAGDRLNQFQKRCWREALGVNNDQRASA